MAPALMDRGRFASLVWCKLMAMAKEPSVTPSDDADPQPGFEQALEELEALIEKIESGQVGLEACLTHYERGMKLIARCQQVLGQAQQRIARLQVKEDGSLASQPAMPDDVIDAQTDDDD